MSVTLELAEPSSRHSKVVDTFFVNDVGFALQKSTSAMIRFMELDGETIGMGLVTKSGEVMLRVLPGFQRQGYGLWALTRLTDLAFEEAKMRKVWATTEIGRPGAYLAAKAGFVEVSQSAREVLFEKTSPLHAASG